MLKPLSADRWNFTTAAHLLNRAGFGGTPEEISNVLNLGPEQAVSHLVDFDKVSRSAFPNMDTLRPALQLLVEYGWLLRYLHSTGASAFFLVVYLHMFRGSMILF